MAILDVLKFWKKREDDVSGFPTGMADFGKEAPEMHGGEMAGMPKLSGFDAPKLAEKMPSDEFGAGAMPGMPGAGMQPMSSAPSPEFRPFPAPDSAMQGTAIEKDLALVSAKLDTLKAKLELIEQKIEKIEKIAEASR